MPPQTKDAITVADLDAVREFLLNGREIPRTESPKRAQPKASSAVQVHHGITRARGHSTPKR